MATLLPGITARTVKMPRPAANILERENTGDGQVLERYQDNGCEVREVLFDGCGHSPHLARPAEFRDALLARITGVSGRLPYRTPGVG
ncbi:hypothetical protein [Mycetocola miduiensis]|uniref:hypothetical protein n=1 Tax=Mycetocola miduiensis TaxID=995034 RepID=UPI000B87B838|nr:hypothetical protein [Mycetocola miduiensis]